LGHPAYYDGNDAASQWKGSFNLTIDIPGVEHLNFVASGAQLTKLSNPAATWKPDYCIDTLNINSATQMMTINVTGDQIAVVNGSSPSLISVDASKLAPVATEVDVVSQVGFIFQGGGQPGTLVTGSQHCGNELYGSNATLVGGPYADLLAGINSSTLTGGGGNDMFRCQPAFLIGLETVTQVGTITDFSPNTRYHGLTGIPNMGGADSSAGSWDWNGDVIDLRAYGKTAIFVSVVANASQVAQGLAADHGLYGMAALLDASTGMLYVDANLDGITDLKIELTGVTTITGNAFLLI
jgi:hypothetical protein